MNEQGDDRKKQTTAAEELRWAFLIMERALQRLGMDQGWELHVPNATAASNLTCGLAHGLPQEALADASCGFGRPCDREHLVVETVGRLNGVKITTKRRGP